MLVFVIALCIGVLVGMAVGGIALTRNRQRQTSQTRARFDDILAPTDPGSAAAADLHPAARGSRDPEPTPDDTTPTDAQRAAEAERAELSEAERAAFDEITRQNFPEATD